MHLDAEQLTVNMDSFFESLARIADPDYIPTDLDVVRCEKRTPAVKESSTIINSITYRFFECKVYSHFMKKFKSCFENMTLIMFVADISQYDREPDEHGISPSLLDTLEIFDSFCKSKWYLESPILLILNKAALFKAKLVYSPLEKYFPDYKGGSAYDAACEYVLNRFVYLNQHDERQIYAHFVSGISDTGVYKFVTAAANDTIIQEHLRNLEKLDVSKAV